MTAEFEWFKMGGLEICSHDSSPNEDVPSLKLTYPLKIDPWKRRFLLETTIFRGYVSFREGIFYGKNRRFFFMCNVRLPEG